MPPRDQSLQDAHAPWSREIEPALLRFCRETVYQPWCQIIAASQGQLNTPDGQPLQSIPPLFDLGPAIPIKLLPLLLHPLPIRAFLGHEPNMITIILNRAHNHIVFLAAERTENGRYVEMIRLDTLFDADEITRLCRMLQAGEDADAFAWIHSLLERHGLARFQPRLLKIADLYFFEAFHRLSLIKQPSLAHLRACFQIAHEIISHRLLYFYPHHIPLERLLSSLRPLLPTTP